MIEQPSNVLVKAENGFGSFTWNPNFSEKWDGKYAATQSRLCQNVLKFSEPYTPKRTGFLISTGSASETDVTWTARYASYRYYRPAKREVGLRGAFWVDRMMKAQGKAVIDDAKQEMR